MKKTKQLSLRERLFAMLYAANGNGAQSAREAGYRGEHGNRALRLMKRPSIREFVDRERARLVAKVELKADRVVMELMRIAFCDPRRLYGPNNNPLPLNELDADTAACISGVSFRNGVAVRLRLHSKITALDLLGTHLGLWEHRDGRSDRLNEVIEAMRSGAVGPVPPDPKDTIQ